MSKKNCELCGKNSAKMYCESDQASLCWDCDSEVHSANFLVEKHSRNLLCHSCQKPTPWTASGPKLSPTLSVCSSCLVKPAAAAVQLRDPIGEIGDRSMGYGERVEENYQTGTDDEDEDEYGSESEIDEYDDGEDNGNQVVPLSSSPSSSFSPPSPDRSVSSSGSYEDLSAARDGGTTEAVSSSSSSPWKRLRESDCLHSEDEKDCSSGLNCHSLLEENKGTSSSIGFLRPMKMLRTSV